MVSAFTGWHNINNTNVFSCDIYMEIQDQKVVAMSKNNRCVFFIPWQKSVYADSGSSRLKLAGSFKRIQW